MYNETLILVIKKDLKPKYLVFCSTYF